MVVIYIDHCAVHLPVGLSLSFGRAQGRDALYCLGAGRRLYVFVAVAGRVRELRGIDRDLIEELRQLHFPREPKR